MKLIKIIKELQVNNPSIKITPTNYNSGVIEFNEYKCVYSVYEHDVWIDLMSDYNLFEEYFEGELDDEEYYPENESELACNDYISKFRGYF